MVSLHPIRKTTLLMKGVKNFMANALLINPPYSVSERYGNDMKKFGAVSEPLGLAYLAAGLEEQGFKVEIIDAPAQGITVKGIVEEHISKETNLVGITFLTPMYNAVKKLANKIKKSHPGVKIIVGGPHPSALPEKTLEEIASIDFICIGEGERTIVEVAEYMAGKKEIENIKGLAYRDSNDIRVNAARPIEKTLDSLPVPARHLLPMKQYKLTASRTRGTGFCPTIILARGCPFNCQFCSHPFGRTFRHHSVKRIIEEIKELVDKYDIKQVNFEADTLTIDKNFVLELCRTMIDQRIDISWTCESRMDTIDEEMLRIMKEAGCWQISYGVESGSQRLLDAIVKGVTKETIIEAFRITKKVGISIRGFFMLGLPTETKYESLQTIHFANKLNPLWAQFTVTIPYPGTPMFEQLDKEGQIRHFDWTDYNTWGGWADKKLPYISSGRTEEEIKKLQKKAMRMFYMRPRAFFGLIRSISSYQDTRKLVNGFIVLIKSAIVKPEKIKQQ